MGSIVKLQTELKKELIENILPFWMKNMQDSLHGGFIGRISGENIRMVHAEKGAILNARILWTFSTAYRVLQCDEYLTMATRAKREIIDRFYDARYGGVYWSLDEEGKPLDTKKQIYALGFAIYGLSEYHRATGDTEALDYAVRLFRSIEEHSFDAEKNGYYEALTREWGELNDMRLSDKDENERKTMNTHLHILESYANLYRVWKNPLLARQLGNLIRLFTDKILNAATGHLELFFDDDWHSKYQIVSYGHDIEASWLLHEAAQVLGDVSLLQRVEPLVELMAAAADEGLQEDGSMVYETFVGRHTDTDRHWWVQAENIVGHINLYQYFDDEVALRKALSCWQFVQQHLIDYQCGEWHWSVDDDGKVNSRDDKAGFWKCPYHNGRMCLEIIERFPV